MTQSIYTQNEALIMGDYGAAEVFRQLILSLFNGYTYPMPVLTVSRLDSKHFPLFADMLEAYHRDGETAELRELACKVLERFPELRVRCVHPESTALEELERALAFYDQCKEDSESRATGAFADSKEMLINAVRHLIKQSRG
ncbi:hypothetical protein GJV52_12775 [Neisseria brasiliensis]|uniref:hypothetical protein n=1 Tax=Neisseria TaxID=482 RepID=UPI000C27C3CE|nr:MULTISPECIES: hypothetical protein [Neisseria]PJO79122.1 hypothetical protein CWC45_01405 [Neisseria sp. N177_16]QGL26325.1 hypothetical protein GJV52_12775 [Neisseria brasiliensis]